MTVQYIYNTETEQILYSESGEWGINYVESTGTFPGESTFKSPWRAATQEEEDAYLLTAAKAIKLTELQNAKTAFYALGFIYGANTFTISENARNNLTFKNSLDAGATDRYKYYDSGRVQIDFGDAAGWAAFYNQITPEIDRIIRYDLAKKKEINDAATVVAVEAITIDFSA